MNPKNLPSKPAPKTRADLMPLMKPVSERYDPQQEAQNAATIGFELEVVSTKVDRFGWRDLSQRMKQRLTDDWTDALRKYPLKEVQRGIEDCLRSNPRRCPNEHEVEAQILRRRKEALQRLPPASEPAQPVSGVSEEEKAQRKEAAARIMKEVMGNG